MTSTMNVLFNPIFLKKFGRQTILQCNSYGSMNVRRIMQTIQLYKRLYNEKTVFGLWKNFSSRWPIFRPPTSLFGGGGVLLTATLFSFSANGIADEEMIR